MQFRPPKKVLLLFKFTNLFGSQHFGGSNGWGQNYFGKNFQGQMFLGSPILSERQTHSLKDARLPEESNFLGGVTLKINKNPY